MSDVEDQNPGGGFNKRDFMKGMLAGFFVMGNDAGKVSAKDFQNYHLLSCPIAGLAHYRFNEVKATIGATMPLVLKREPTNKYDQFAIEVYTTTGEKLGYVPRLHNLILSNLMEQGVMVSSTIVRAKLDDIYNGVWMQVGV